VYILRWLGVFGSLALFAMSAQAQATVSTFSGAATDTTYTEYGSMSGYVVNDGPSGPDVNYYRLTTAGVGSTNNMVVFDLTAPGATSHVVGDFDFRIGGMAGTHADGMGVALLPTSIYGPTGNGLNGAKQLPGISEEASQGGDGSVGFGLDTYNNGAGDIGNSALPNSTDSSEISLNYQGAHSFSVYGVDLYGQNGYNLHQDVLDDTATPFDHCHFTVDIDANGGGARVTVTITSHQKDATNNQPFTAVSGVIPGVVPYEMRLGFGGRTGGANDSHDIANVNVTYSP
jgi:hypothetical protein